MTLQILSALTKTHKLLIILPILICQFALAVFCLRKLAFCNISVRQYIIWNVFIVVGVFVGGITFLIYYFTHKEKLLKEKSEIILDQPLDKANGEAESQSAVGKTETAKEENATASIDTAKEENATTSIDTTDGGIKKD